MHHVHAPERVTRAVGVYEWTGDLDKPTAARFVPVSLFINGRFEDAGLYMARPIPFALEPGDVYALEHAGEPEGLLDLDFASRVVTGNALADDDPEGAWYGYGRFTPEPAIHVAKLRPSTHLTRIKSSAGPNTPPGTKLPTDGESDRPHMQRRDGGSTAGGAAQPDKSADTPAGASTASSDSSRPADNSDDDLDRPTLRRRDPSQDAARRREYGSKKNTASVTAAGPALGDDPDRPILGHSSADTAGTPPLTGLPADMRQMVAVSDPRQADAHPLARDWDSPAEKSSTMTAMEALARPLVSAYLQDNALVPSNRPIATPEAAKAGGRPVDAADTQGGDGPGPPKLQRGVPQQYKDAAPPPATAVGSRGPARTAPAKAGAHAAHARSGAGAKPAAGLKLQQAEISGFMLSYGGLPTFVYTAVASVASKAAAEAKPGSQGVAYVTVVAQRLATGELQVAMSSVTDSNHLERGPRLRLIDAVDPDDSHRASLLFELRGANRRQFALFRLTAVHAQQTFTTASIE